MNRNGDSGSDAAAISGMSAEEGVTKKKEQVRFSLSPSKPRQSPPNFSFNDVVLFFAKFLSKIEQVTKVM